MKAVILSAGMGERLLPLTRNTPKSLLELGNGFTVLEWQLEAIKACGIEDVRIVTGYKSEQIEAKVAGTPGLNVEIVYNPFYRTTNNLCSAWFGVQGLDGSVVLLNGDDVFKMEVLKRLLESTEEQTSVVSMKDRYDEEDMKVVLDHAGKVIRFGKDIPLDEAQGEAIGITLFHRRGLAHLRKTLDVMMRDERSFSVFYLAAYQRMIAEGARFATSPCVPDEWAEIDFHPDVEAVKKSVLVEIPV